MNSNEPIRVRFHQPDEAIAYLPYEIGYHPTESMVVAGQRADNRLAVLLRLDLPEGNRDNIILAHSVLAALRSRDCAKATIVVVTEPGLGLKQHQLVQDCSALWAATGIETYDCFWAAGTTPGAPWRAYGDDRAGVTGDLRGSPVHTAFVADGRVLFKDRAAMAELLRPDPADQLGRRRTLLDAKCTGATTRPPTELAALVDAAIDNAVNGILPNSDDAIVDLLHALTDKTVRDLYLHFDDDVRAAAATRLWQRLVCAAPAPDIAEAACLFAVSALLRGDGVLARLALNRAREANPDHKLTGLLTDAISAGITPHRLKEAAENASAESREILKLHHGSE